MAAAPIPSRSTSSPARATSTSCRATATVSGYLDRPGIVVEGFVADVRPAYQRAAVVVAPLVASAGTNIKILEAMAMGKAMVSTPAGVNGLDLYARARLPPSPPRRGDGRPHRDPLRPIPPPAAASNPPPAPASSGISAGTP